jgi:hypothetical protein
VQDAAEQQADRLVPVQVLAHLRVGEKAGRVPEVAVHGEGHLVVGEQRPGVGQDDRVVVEVDHPGSRVDRVGDLVHVLRGRQPGADVEELSQARLADQVPDHAAEQVTLRPDTHLHGGKLGDDLIGDGPVGGEVVLAAEQVVIHPGDVRLRGVEYGIWHQPMLSEGPAWAYRWA